MFHPDKYFIRLLLAIMAVQACLLLSVLNLKSFTADECYELRNLSFDPIVIARDGDGFPPLFRWLLSFSISLTGEPLARVFPLLTSLLGTFVVGWAGRKIAGDRGGLAGALLFALSACQLEYAQQLRAYSLYILLVACNMLAFFAVIQRGNATAWIFFAVTTCFAMLTHYFAALVAMVLWAWLGILILQDQSPWKSRRQHLAWTLKSIVLSVTICALLMIPVLFALNVDLAQPPPAEVVNPVDLSSVAYLYYSLTQGWCLGPSSLELQALSFRDAVQEIIPWAVIGFGAAACLIWGAWSNSNRRILLVLLGLLVLPTAFSVALSFGFGFSFVSRYLACLIVPVALVVSLALERTDRKAACYAFVVLLVLNGWSFFNRNANSRYDRENYRLVIEEIKRAEPTPRVFVLSHYVSHAVRRAAPEHWDIVPVSFYSDDPPETSDFEVGGVSIQWANSWVVAEWFPEKSELRSKRDLWIERVGAVSIKRVSNNLELFKIPSSTSIREQ